MPKELLPDKEAFQARVNELIDEVGSKEKFGKLSGVSGVMIGKYASGISDPGREKLIAMARAAGVNLLWFATGEGPKRPSGKYVSYSTGVVQADNIEGSAVVAGAGNASIRDGGKAARNLFISHSSDDDVTELVDLLNTYGNPAMIAEIKGKLLKIKDIIEN